jgi:hypothetical protein
MFRIMYGVNLNGKDNGGKQWTHHTTMIVFLIFKHVNFQKTLEEDIFNSYGEEFTYDDLNEERSGLNYDFSQNSTVENLNLFCKNMIDKTYFKIMKKNGINKNVRPDFTSTTKTE